MNADKQDLNCHTPPKIIITQRHKEHKDFCCFNKRNMGWVGDP